MYFDEIVDLLPKSVKMLLLVINFFMKFDGAQLGYPCDYYADSDEDGFLDLLEEHNPRELLHVARNRAEELDKSVGPRFLTDKEVESKIGAVVGRMRVNYLVDGVVHDGLVVDVEKSKNRGAILKVLVDWKDRNLSHIEIEDERFFFVPSNATMH